MIDTDFAAFEDAFKRLSGSLNRKFTTTDFRSTVQIFFEALKAFELQDVLDAVPKLRERNRWPKVGDWIAAIPIKPAITHDRIMSFDEAAEYLDALQRHYHGEPCTCLRCQEAGVTDLPIRFVPDFTSDDLEARAFCRPLNRMVVSGHWAHGQELRRWYDAKAAFAAAVPHSLRRAVRRILHPREQLEAYAREREPGEDG